MSETPELEFDGDSQAAPIVPFVIALDEATTKGDVTREAQSKIMRRFAELWAAFDKGEQMDFSVSAPTAQCLKGLAQIERGEVPSWT